MLNAPHGLTCEHCKGRMVYTRDGSVCSCEEKRRLRLYVAGPMSGIPLDNHPAFEIATRELRDAGYDVASPHLIDAHGKPGGRPWQWYMRRCLPLLMRSDGVALLEGWEASAGARIEVENALPLGMPVHTKQEWLDIAARKRERAAEREKAPAS